jgi:hypothetical protein
MHAGTGPKEGVRWFDYAKDCLAKFETPLSEFCFNSKGGCL